MNKTIFTTLIRAEKILSALKTSQSHTKIQPHKERKALSLIVEANLDQRVYELIQKLREGKHSDFYPYGK